MIAITGSKIHRVWKCPASVVLPQIDSEDDGHGPARQRGQAIHAFLERVNLVGRDVALAEVTDKALLPLLQALDLEALPTHLATEVAFAWSWRTGIARELGRNLDRQYVGIVDDEIPCTLDLVGVDGQRGYVGDYKTGHAKLPPPDRNGQLLLGALCARSVYRLSEVVVELIHIHSDGDHHTVRRTVDAWDLSVFAAELSAAMAAVERGRIEYAAGRALAAHEGPHCEHCGAYKNCPAKVALVRSIPAELVRLETPGTITVRSAAEIWMALERITEVVSRAKEEICGMAAHEPIDLPDGRVIGMLHTERRKLDGRIAAEVLEERYGREAVEETIELTCSMEALQRAVVKRKGPKEKAETRDGTGVVDRVIQELYRRGGVKLTITDAVKPHVPRKRLTSG